VSEARNATENLRVVDLGSQLPLTTTIELNVEGQPRYWEHENSEDAKRTVPSLRSVAGLAPRRAGLNPRRVHMGFILDSVALKADSHIAFRVHAVPPPCRALIHRRHAAPLPCSESAVSFVKVRVVAGNIQTASPTV
jgi:hypothetical protein